ncbi:hypothetical protein OS493_025319 [Desmophyllum pertusum]|uniref:Uncharacterized protein n=1 Tax=Desmophyllum pertusum TaxID=174260 RepID=A0A9W9ZA94_9CNID|nr:hypothetical protein OS493_025319 [Desmophyllum pertusum]
MRTRVGLFLRRGTWSNSTFTSGLSDSRSLEEKANIVDEFFKRYENQVAKASGGSWDGLRPRLHDYCKELTM